MGSVAMALGATPEAAAAPAPEAGTSAAAGTAEKQMFLELLVAQIRNQNPLEPMQGIEFLTELAQFSALEQLAAIRSELAALRAALKPAGPADSGGSGT
jgi:flagellar basal-body rod modification protein FlgD